MLDLTTPALLFPALSLLLLAYTNRFLTLAGLIRSLHKEYHEARGEPREGRSNLLIGQIRNLQRRISLIKAMQIFGVSSLFLCVLTMGLLFFRLPGAGEAAFALSLLAMLASLALSITELSISVNALNLQLSDLEEECEREQPDGD
jgi:hypothetical protein